jgi:hypothetical protein
MLQVISALKGFTIEASDGRIGAVVDFLFDDAKWSVRWLVVDCGTWLRGRKVLIPPSAVSPYRFQEPQLEVKLTKAQVEASPELSEDEPVSQQMERRLYAHYGWDPNWDAPYIGSLPGAASSPFMPPPYFGLGEGEPRPQDSPEQPRGDSHLRSVVEVTGYKIHALDGEIGHVENFMIDVADWRLHYFVVDTSNWWFGKRVLISPLAVKHIKWSDRHIELNVFREQVKSSPPWDPLVAFNDTYKKQLHRHYGWAGSGA